MKTKNKNHRNFVAEKKILSKENLELVTNSFFTDHILNVDEINQLKKDNNIFYIVNVVKLEDKNQNYLLYNYIILANTLDLESFDFVIRGNIKFELTIKNTLTQIVELEKSFRNLNFDVNSLEKEEKERVLSSWLPKINQIDNIIKESIPNIKDKISLSNKINEFKSKIAKTLDLSSQQYSKQEMINIHNDKKNEYIKSLVNTELSKNINNINKIQNIIASTNNDAELYKKQVNDKIFNIMISSDMDTNVLINLLIADKYDSIFKYYDRLFVMLTNNQIRNFDYDKHLEEMFKTETNLENQFIFLEEERTIIIVYNKELILFKFKNILIQTNSTFTPGFSVIQDFKNNCKTLVHKEVREKDIEQVDSTIEFDLSSGDQEFLLKLCASKLNLTVKEYINDLAKYNNMFYYDLKDKKYRLQSSIHIQQNVNIEDVKLSASKYYNQPICEKLLTTIVWFTSKDISKEFKRLNPEFECFIRLYDTLTDDEKQKLITYNNCDSLDNESDFPIIITNEHEKVVFKENNFYMFDNLKGKDIQKYYMGKTREEIFELSSIKSIELLNKMKKTKLSKLEVYEASFPFRFVNKKAFQVTNLDIRAQLELINNKNLPRKTEIIDLLIMRMGDYSTLLCSMISVLLGVKISKEASELLKSLKWTSVRTKEWVSYFGKLSLAVKTSKFINGYKLNIHDFKNLQYLELFVGQLGNDAKSPKEIAKDRMYQQIKKKILFWGQDVSTEEQIEAANNECYKLYKYYWDRVFTELKNKNEKYKYPGIVQILNDRARFATTSSSGGIKSGYNNIDYLKRKFKLTDTFVENYESGQTNKMSSFISESDLWFQRVLFDIPITMSNMVPKPKEFAKQRYIFGVLSMHYLFNSIATYEFEKYMNHLGIQQTTDDTNDFYHNFRHKGSNNNIFNCIDYSVFNDQHEKQHKQTIWIAYRDSAKSFFNEEDYREIELVSIWMESSCELMWLRFTGDRTIMIRHEGRLFSGERSTTFVNSMMSVFYMYIISRNTIDYIYNIVHKEPRLIDNSGIDLESLQQVNKNKTLGDDNILELKSDVYSRIMNEMALYSGLILKVEKCMIGLDISEFLRKIDFKQNLYNIKKGYVNRSIVSFIAGNLEGSIERDWAGRISQIYDQICIIIQRSGNINYFEYVFEHLAVQISAINRKFKEITNQKLPIEWFYTQRSFGGLGLMKLSTKQYYKPKRSFKKNRKPLNYFLTKIHRVDLTLYNNKIKPVLYNLIKFGIPKWQSHKSEINRAYESIITSNSVISNLYSQDYLLEQAEVIEDANQIVKMGGKMVDLLVYNDKVEQFVDTINKNFDEGNREYRRIVKKFEKIDNIERSFHFIITKYTLKQIIEKIGGLSLLKLYEYKKVAERYNIVVEYIENNIANELIAPAVLMDNKSQMSLHERLSALRLYFERKFSLV